MANQSGAAAPVKGATQIPGRKKWTIEGIEYVQDELTFVEKSEFFGLLTQGIDQALAQGLQINSLVGALKGVDLTAGSEVDRDTVEEIWGRIKEEDPEKFIGEFGSLILRIFSSVPKLTPDAIMLALSIPEEDRDGFRREKLSKITDDQGFGIMGLFVQQNGRALLDFARRWWVEVLSPAVSNNQA